MEFTLIPNGDNGHEKTLKKTAQQWSKYVVIKTSQKKISPKLYVLVPQKEKLYVLEGTGVGVPNSAKESRKGEKIEKLLFTNICLFERHFCFLK